VALAIALAPAAPRLTAADPLPLAGLLPVDDTELSVWPWSGAWVWPLGGEMDFSRPTTDGTPPWRLLRGFTPAKRGVRPHEGADLGNGRAGDPVRAAAHGLVVATRDGSDGSGYGVYVVLAHHLREGDLAYSVYAHLQPGSIRVQEGRRVWAGDVLAAVGHSGRASTDHLHFEVRLAGDPGQRWEHARAVDPIHFLSGRLPGHLADTTGTAVYLDWADRAGLIEDGADASAELRPAEWQRMLARAACLPLLSPPRTAMALAEMLTERGLLPGASRALSQGHVAWGEMGRDLARLGGDGTRLPPPPVGANAHRAACETRFHVANPSADSTSLRGFRRPPTLADACMLLADLAARAAGPLPREGTRR